MSFPITRMRRLRKNRAIRSMVCETDLDTTDFIMPLFVCTGKGQRRAIASMPGVFQLSVDELLKECEKVADALVPAILLFGVGENKDEDGRHGYRDDGVVQCAIREIKKHFPDLYLITDVCTCAYTVHGHCGPIVNGDVDNDAALEILALQALSHARAGADMVAPSDMMDGRVGRIRAALDKEGFYDIPIMSYSAKYASAFYSPFREAVGSSPRFGNRLSYQMDPANANEALREVALDIEEGADVIMIKPALSYLDIIYRVKSSFKVPVAAFNVSGEYAMVKASAEKGWLCGEDVMMEILLSIKRAGADCIISYHALQMANMLKNK